MLETIVTSAITAFFVAVGTGLVQEQRLRREFKLDVQRVRTEFMAERLVKDLLDSPAWEKRTFAAIQRRVGGFSEDALRQILVRAGAVRFENSGGEELWGLLSRNKDAL